MEKGLFSWLREQFVPSEGAGEQPRPSGDDYLSRRQLVARLGRDPYPEWFAGFSEHLWPDRVMFEWTREAERLCKAVAEYRAELEERRKAMSDTRARRTDAQTHPELEEKRKAVAEARAKREELAADSEEWSSGFRGQLELERELSRAQLDPESVEKELRLAEERRDLWVWLAMIQKAPEFLTRGEVTAHLGSDRYPEWFAGFPEHLWPDHVALEGIVSIEEECGKVTEAQAERKEKYAAAPEARAALEPMRKAIAQARAELEAHAEDSKEREAIEERVGKLARELEEAEAEVDSDLEYADSNVEDAERDRDNDASSEIQGQMCEELEELAPAIIRVVDHELGLGWTEKDARLLEELRAFYARTQRIHAPTDGDPPAVPEYPESWLDPELVRFYRENNYPGLASPLFSDELGRLTKEDFAFIHETKHLSLPDDYLFDISNYDWDEGRFKLDAYPRTEAGRRRFAELFAERRKRQRELMDKLRSPAFRARMGNVEKALGEKRGEILAAASEGNDDVANTVRGEMFERYVAKVLSAEWQGFECEHLGLHKRTERGIDLLFRGPNGEKFGVQCKQHADTREPSYQEWQFFFAGCTFHNIPEGSRVFVTTGSLTVSQMREAKKLGVVVFYKDELAQMAKEHGIEPWM